MTRDRFEGIRNEYTVDGKLDVRPDDPRFQAALLNMARDREAAERGQVDIVAGGQGRADREVYDSGAIVGLAMFFVGVLIGAAVIGGMMLR